VTSGDAVRALGFGRGPRGRSLLRAIVFGGIVAGIRCLLLGVGILVGWGSGVFIVFSRHLVGVFGSGLIGVFTVFSRHLVGVFGSGLIGVFTVFSRHLVGVFTVFSRHLVGVFGSGLIGMLRGRLVGTRIQRVAMLVHFVSVVQTIPVAVRIVRVGPERELILVEQAVTVAVQLPV
jgi:hypothetical protein